MRGGMGFGMGKMYAETDISSKEMARRLKFYKEDLEEQIKYIEKRMSELQKEGKEGDGE